MLKKIFSFQNDGSSHITLILFGIKFHILQPELRKKRGHYKELYSNKSNIENIPPANGNLRLIQLANLGLLRQLDKICKKYEISYWLDFGTLLGAKRHRGFIPWDDDIDIGMMRSDYEKFIKLFSNGFPDYPDLYYLFSCNGRNKCFVKFKHKNSNNLFIDIFPYDIYPKPMDKYEKNAFSQKIAKLVKPNIFKYYKTPELTRKHLSKITKEKLLNNSDAVQTENYSVFWGLDFPHRWINKVYDSNQIFPLQNIEFEGYLFPAPNSVHEVLSSIYGNYMSIPKDVYPRHSNYNMPEKELKLIKKLVEEV